MPENRDSIGGGRSILAGYLLGDETLAETLTHVVDVAKESLPADMAGITMMVDGKPSTAVFTDDEAPEIDDHQYHGDGGPCMVAFTTNRVVGIGSVPDDTRWPKFTATAGRYGIQSTLSLPLSGPDGALGALNLYSRERLAFNFQDEEIGAELAAQAAVLLLNAQAHADARQLNDNLNQALSSRSTIDYAIGILIAQSGHTPEDAFALLVRASQRENRKLRDIAAELVKRATSQARRSMPSGRTVIGQTPNPPSSQPESR